MGSIDRMILPLPRVIPLIGSLSFSSVGRFSELAGRIMILVSGPGSSFIILVKASCIIVNKSDDLSNSISFFK